MHDLPGLNDWEEQFTAALRGATVRSLICYNVNPNYFAFDPEKIWVLDGGISFTLANNTTVSYCWHKEMELMDMRLGEAKELLGDLDFYAVNDVTARVQAALGDKTISDVHFEWNWYQKMNDDFELDDTLHFAPLGITLTFTDGSTLQLGSIQFSVNAEDKRLANVSYLTEGDLLVALNTIIPVEMPDDEPM